jgi:hypothetical protein
MTAAYAPGMPTVAGAARLASIPDDPSPYEPLLRAAVAGVDPDAAVRTFRAQGDFIFLERFLPDAYVEMMADELRRFAPSDEHRVYVPFVRKAGTIGQRAIARRAPALYALYRSPSILELTTRLSGQTLSYKSDGDAHAAALYVYRRPGDHVGWHYDDCGCERAASYTATFGLVNRTASRVHFEIFREDPTRTPLFHSIALTPGSFVFFCGTKAYHRVTALSRHEERVAYSFAYVTEGKRLRGYARFKENIKDAILYFGPKALFQDNYR